MLNLQPPRHTPTLPAPVFNRNAPNSGHSPMAWRTGNIDSKLKFRVCKPIGRYRCNAEIRGLSEKHQGDGSVVGAIRT